MLWQPIEVTQGPVPTESCLSARLANSIVRTDWLGPWFDSPAKYHCLRSTEDWAQPDHLPAAPNSSNSLQVRGLAQDRARMSSGLESWAFGCALGPVWKIQPLDNRPWAICNTNWPAVSDAPHSGSPAMLDFFLKIKGPGGQGRLAFCFSC